MGLVQVEIKSREIIKPSSPTPNNLKTFKLSLLDQFAPPEHVPNILYYAPYGENPTAKTPEKIDLLKKSLSRTLTQFYPLAGRVRENLFIDCNDEGAEFLVAKVNCPLSQILKQPEADVLDLFLPKDYHVTKLPMEYQVAIQVNTFSCGGMAIGVSGLHKLLDGMTFLSFINSWAALARGSGESSPIFIGPHLFPPRDFSGLLPTLDIPKAKCFTKRFVFDGSKIALLREKMVKSSSVDHPSRLEVVSGLIWKCAMDTARTKMGSSGPSAATQTVNLRSRMDPPLPEYTAGNILWLSIALAPKMEGQIEVSDLVDLIRNAIKVFDEEHLRKMQGENGFFVLWESLKKVGELMSNNVDIYRFTSLGRQRLYEVDFGWGKPVWFSMAGLVYKNVVILIETRFGDGIEAWVTLEEQDMAMFEQNPELVSFVSPTQSASFLLLDSHL